MRLIDLLQGIAVSNALAEMPELDITAVEIDSRKVKHGSMFVAIKGTTSDGHDYVAQAIERGAVCVVVEHECSAVHEANAEVIEVVVPNTEAIVGEIAHNFYGRPSEQLTLVGVTGTNGKTTIATTLYNLFRSFGYKAGLLSTVCNYIDDRYAPATQTTPDPVSLNAMLREMVDAGCEYAFMEVSSHSIVQHRVGGLSFAGGIFTNLTLDHLDYHKTFEEYRDVKKSFFDGLGKQAFAITNIDDSNGTYMTQNCNCKTYTYSLRTLADYKCRIIETGFDGMLLDMDGRQVAVSFVGKFNAYNLLAIYATACLLGMEKEESLVHLSAMKPVNGRFEPVMLASGAFAIVDYAHTPDALINVLDTIRPLLTDRGQLITVVGCGGNRDKSKRPIMAREAARRSDILILTSDNPRFEEPDDIINDMQSGLSPQSASAASSPSVAFRAHTILSITDRRQAIRAALGFAKKGDVVLVAGKGHETYQEIKGVKHHFDDHEEVLADVSQPVSYNQ